MSDLFPHHPPYARWAHVMLRVFAGAIIVQHGAQKVLGILGGVDGAGHTAIAGSLSSFAGPIELLGGLLIILGLFTRPVAFILAGEMAVAYFWVHFHRSFWPIINKGELASTLCFVYLYFAATGAGAFSLDYLRARRHPQPIMQ